MPHSKHLSQQTASRMAEVDGDFVDAPWFPHTTFDDFLTADFAKDLADAFPAFEASAAINEMGAVGAKAHRSDVLALGEPFRRLDDLLRSEQFLAGLSRCTGIDDLLYDSEYVGGGTHENLNGNELDVHVDFNYHPTTGWHRRLNLILFLNEDWEADWGGCLSLYDDPWKSEERCRTFAPRFNRAVLFATNERSWHGFDRIAIPPTAAESSRKTFAVYFYTRERPAAETQVSHATFYVPRPLSKNLHPGRVLTEQDVEELSRLVAKRDQLIRFLYHREIEFQETIDGLMSRLRQLDSEQLATRLSNGLESLGPAQGAWADGWFGVDARWPLGCSRPGKTLELRGWLPEGNDAPELTLDFGTGARTYSLQPGDFEIRSDHPIESETIELHISCSTSWQPESDQRALAWLLRSMELVD